MKFIIDDAKIQKELDREPQLSKEAVKDILLKARQLKGISASEVLSLMKIQDIDLVKELFDTAKFVKNEIYGNRLVLFAPLYISNLCSNNCQYCAFRSDNKELKRISTPVNKIADEVKILINQGHKRLLLVSGETSNKDYFNYILDAIEAVYSVKILKGNIRRLNVNIAPLTFEEFKRLKSTNIGTYQLFQETYHKDSYKIYHPQGPKSNYEGRLEVMDHAIGAGISDVGIGVLFGLYDWRYEILAMLQHIEHFENKFGVGPHTISIPRLEPALNSQISYHPPYLVDDFTFKKMIAVLRLAVPYTGIILSTRENPELRNESIALGISQMSAGSSTSPGGYCNDDDKSAQFSLGDHRNLEEVIESIVDVGYIPSFCTSCYRLGRVGKDFMDLAKPGLIRKHCLPNALFTFMEYINDFAGQSLKEKADKLVNSMIEKEISDENLKQMVRNKIQEINKGMRDFCV